MVGVDAYDQHVFSHTISRKVDRWPIRIIESCLTFGLVNARAAYCIKNNIDFTKFSIKQFYLEILRAHYPPVSKISKIKLGFKAKSTIYKHCVWKNCKQKTNNFCDNENCRKLACKQHMMILCCECFSSDPSDIITIPDHNKNPARMCKIKNFCKICSRVLCASASCARNACADHRNPIC